jgi:hypothetical protein
MQVCAWWTWELRNPPDNFFIDLGIITNKLRFTALPYAEIWIGLDRAGSQPDVDAAHVAAMASSIARIIL